MSRLPGELLKWTEPDPLSAGIVQFVTALAAADGQADEATGWPADLWTLIENAGATRWSLPSAFGGDSCPRPLLVQRYAQLASGSLTAVFILSQHDAAVRRLVDAATNNPTAAHWLREIGAGRAFVTVGISHLTTSRRLGAQPVTAVEIPPGSFRFNGAIPWVTAAEHAQLVVTGAVLADGRKVLVALPTNRPGFVVRPPFTLAALQASCTTEVMLENVEVSGSDVLAGPAVDVLSQPGAVGTAGLETSALALGQAHAALFALAQMAPPQAELDEPLELLCESWHTLWCQLVAQARGEPGATPASQIRSAANTLVLRSTQAYLTVMKGTGFLKDEPAQRWARQALFFLVWSCPTPVAHAAIRDLVGLCQV
jgi:alkylation response protein AidB-like acyl-CoA dehydrogenase